METRQKIHKGTYITNITYQKLFSNPYKRLEEVEVIQNENEIIRNHYKNDKLVSQLVVSNLDELVSLDKEFTWEVVENANNG